MPTKKYHHGDLKNALIKSGIEILSKEGASGLSLRKAARKVGVSHSAPYAHFSDKQALIAAISTQGFKRLYEQIRAAVEAFRGDPGRQLVEAGWAYVQFAVNDPDHFKITLSSVLEKEREYPDFVEISRKNFLQVVEIITACQSAGILRAGPPDLLALSVWSCVHGFVSLLLEGQVPHTINERFSLREMLVYTLDQMTLIDILPLGITTKSN